MAMTVLQPADAAIHTIAHEGHSYTDGLITQLLVPEPYNARTVVSRGRSRSHMTLLESQLFL